MIDVNKADREGAGQLHHFIEQMLTYKETEGDWRVPVWETSATQGVGIEALHKQRRQQDQHLLNSGGKQKKRLDREKKRDPEVFRREFGGEFIGSISAYLPAEAGEACFGSARSGCG